MVPIPNFKLTRGVLKMHMSVHGLPPCSRFLCLVDKFILMAAYRHRGLYILPSVHMNSPLCSGTYRHLVFLACTRISSGLESVKGLHLFPMFASALEAETLSVHVKMKWIGFLIREGSRCLSRLDFS